MPNNKIPVFKKIMYGLGEFPGTLIISLINFFLLYFLTDFLRISPIWAGVINFLGIAFDAITDPYAGYLSDKNRHPMGRRKIFLLTFAVPMGLSFLLLFCVPQLVSNNNEFIKVIVVLLLYLLFVLMLTLYRMPYGAVVSDMTDDYDERTSLAAFRTTFIIIATLVSVVVPELLGLTKITTESGQGFMKLGIIMGGVIAVTALLAVLGIKEKPLPENMVTEKFSFKKYFLDSWKIKPFRQACLNFLFTNICITTINVALIYFLTYWLELPKLFTPIAGAVVVLAMFFIPIWSIVCKKIGKNKAQNLGSLCLIVGLVSLVLTGHYGISTQGGLTTVETSMVESLKLFPWWAYISIVLIALGFGAFEMIPYSILPDAINFCHDSNKRDEGSYYGVVAFVFKVGKSIPLLLMGAILEITKYIEPAESITENTIMAQNNPTRWAIIFMFIFVPAICAALAALIMRKYQITRQALKEKVDNGSKEGV